MNIYLVHKVLTETRQRKIHIYTFNNFIYIQNLKHTFIIKTNRFFFTVIAISLKTWLSSSYSKAFSSDLSLPTAKKYKTKKNPNTIYM